MAIFLYIPHGSDESDVSSCKSLLQTFLYIPHGSDERKEVIKIIDKYLDFISHMVQMKVVFILSIALFIINFISHMVQMKAGGCAAAQCRSIGFISHMVQMKVIEHPEEDTPPTMLYIPHGSDERQGSSEACRYMGKTLYPTWFR